MTPDKAPSRLRGATGSSDPAESGIAARYARALCICVDDVGMNTGIGEAALELVASGRVQALGCMVGGKAWDEAAPGLRGLHQDHADVGLHLDFTEFPLLIPARRLPAVIASCYLRRIARASVRSEIRAQLDRFEQTIGRAPAFVDGHQHVHQLPIVRGELIEELTARYSRDLPWLRSTRGARGLAVDPAEGWGFRLKPRIIEALGASALARLAQRARFQRNRHLLGVYDFEGGSQRYLALLKAWIEAASNADLLMCHPGRTREADDALCHSRRAEHEVLAGAEFTGLIAAHQITLAPMSRILSAQVAFDMPRPAPSAPERISSMRE